MGVTASVGKEQIKFAGQAKTVTDPRSTVCKELEKIVNETKVLA